MKKYYFLFVEGQAEPIPVRGESINTADGSLRVYDENNIVVCKFANNRWFGFTTAFLDDEEDFEEGFCPIHSNEQSH